MLPVFKAFLMIGAIAAAGSAGAEQRFVDGPRGGGVMLVDGPNSTARPVLTMARGTRVNLVETWYGWGLIELSNGMSGWAPERHLARYLKRKPAAAKPVVAAVKPKVTPKPAPANDPEPVDVPAYTTVVWPKDGKLNLRAGPGLQHDVLTKLPRGDWVEVFQRAGDWARVRCMTGEVGWTHTAYLTR